MEIYVCYQRRIWTILKKSFQKLLRFLVYRVKVQIRIRFNPSGSRSDLAKKFQLRPDPNPQHCFKK
jgi:hypothetical protein